MRFADPWFLLLLAIPAALALRLAPAADGSRPRSASDFPRSPSSTSEPRAAGGPAGDSLPDALGSAALALLILALARPQVAARRAGGEEQGAEPHGRARHLQQHEGDGLQAGQPAGGRATGAGRLRPAAPGRSPRSGDLRRPLLPPGAAHARYRAAGRDARAGGDRSAARRHRHRHGARAVPQSAQGPAQPRQRHRAHHRRRQQHRVSPAPSSPPRRHAQSACGSTPSA